MTSPDSVGPRWFSIPQPTSVALTGGDWRQASVHVIAEASEFEGEARRLERELAELGIEHGGRSAIRLRAGGWSGESFSVVVADDVEVNAGTPAGVFRATRQLLQNLRAHGVIPRGRVESAPAVVERGFHLDAARKYFSSEWMITLLHELADVGINTFQWHFSENEGFRLASERFPEIVSAEHVTRDEAARVLDAAADLHIDVIPSLDMPGHLRHALAQHPSLRLPSAGALETDHALDVTRADAVRFAENLIDDVAPVFARSTRWNLGGDEFVDFARIDEYPVLAEAAHERFGPEATGFDLLTGFVNGIGAHLRERGFAARAWNDGMLRSSAVTLDQEIALTWWTNWHAQMRPVADAVGAGHALVNFNDALFYYVLGEQAGYSYPTSERIWAADWHPGLFSALPGGRVQEIAAPYPDALLGVAFSVWSDDPAAQSPQEVADGIRGPLRAMAERAWNGGSALTHEEFLAVAGRLN
ncbi:family 20 glycosylhydrolase [Agromyces laixinhei]|uniref:family 20 glycosylhydrolase n=1 Tax=Agromyces laixinhei TaxID=2585717 RepID=UPI0012ED0685|nr:family 20 glycosylhydrolase [Agromyces laixinhei]